MLVRALLQTSKLELLLHIEIFQILPEKFQENLPSYFCRLRILEHLSLRFDLNSALKLDAVKNRYASAPDMGVYGHFHKGSRVSSSPAW